MDGVKSERHMDRLMDKLPWVALNLACCTWPALHKALLRYLAEPENREGVMQKGMPVLETALPGLSEKLVVMQRSRAFSEEIERLQRSQVTLLTLVDSLYPPLLRRIASPPPVLYVRGTLQPQSQFAVAVVGSRKPSPYGRMMAQRLSAALAQHGYTVVSGLARGIDSLAHEGALHAGGQTLAVLGSGINVVYPPENRRLYERIGEHGAVLSEFPFNTKPDRWNFPRRNRIISGLALGTLVIEATAHSGSLHTARHALEQDREVFAVPGRIDTPNSQGTNGLIKSGAKLVEEINDILEEFPAAVRDAARPYRVPVASASEDPPPPTLSAQEAQVLALLQAEETHIDAVIHASQLPAQVVASILVMLELRGLVQQFPGKFFACKARGTAETIDERN
jgi:DNA processing protein